MFYTGPTEAREHWGGGGGGADRYEVMLPLKIFKTKFPSLLIRFIMTIDGKYKTSRANISRFLFYNVFDYWGLEPPALYSAVLVIWKKQPKTAHAGFNHRFGKDHDLENYFNFFVVECCCFLGFYFFSNDWLYLGSVISHET